MASSSILSPVCAIVGGTKGIGLAMAKEWIKKQKQIRNDIIPKIYLLGRSINLKENKAEQKSESIEILKKEFNFTDDQIKDKGLNFHLLVPRPERQKYIDDIEKLDGFEYDPTPSGFSSIGYLLYGDVKIAVKPSGIQGKKSAGLDNEDILEKEQ